MENQYFRLFTTTSLTTSDDITIYLKYGGKGEPLLLLHGYPQTHLMWHKVANLLAQHFTLVIPDLRGYGNSSKPTSDVTHKNYSKRAMANDLIEVMSQLGYKKFIVIGHDRGARVAHRLTLDHPEKVAGLVVLDTFPGSYIYKNLNLEVAKAYFHWFFLIQPNDLPENLIAANPQYYFLEIFKRWSKDGLYIFPPKVLNEYLRCSSKPDAIHAACEDYRAAASIDLIHDQTDEEHKIQCPLLIVWAKHGFTGKYYNVLDVWRNYANHIEEQAIDCGHFIPEEAPEETYQILYNWLINIV